MNASIEPLRQVNTGEAQVAHAGPDDETLLFHPNISINGAVTDDTLIFFLDRLQQIRRDGSDLIMEICTSGGDADVARRIALEIRLFRRYSGRRAYVVGKTRIYSAGVTMFAAFPKEVRYMTEDAVLLIHERRLSSSISFNGPLKSCIQIAHEQLSMLETAFDLEREGFEEFVQDSDMSMDELWKRAKHNCYMCAQEALKLRLINGILR